MGALETRSPWGWNEPARVFLALLASAIAVGLLATPRDALDPANNVPPLVIDLNTAPPAVLVALPRLGPSLVSRIVEARDRAPFRSLDDLDARVQGIGPSTITALKPFLRIDTTKP